MVIQIDRQVDIVKNHLSGSVWNGGVMLEDRDAIFPALAKR
jgi:hypothetical protein